MFKKFRLNRLNAGAPEFLAIGDMVTDAFIRLKDASVHCKMNRENCELCLRFADKVPFEFVEVVHAVGNAANAAVAASRLGLSSALMSDIGGDNEGRECTEELKKNKVSVKYISKHAKDKTNYHYVLWFEDERTILIKHEDYDYRFRAPRQIPRWVYLSSLGANSLSYQLQIADWLKTHHGESAKNRINLAFQPGTFQINIEQEKLESFYRLAKVFFCNVEEAKRILKWDERKADDANTLTGNDFPDSEIKNLLTAMHKLGPKIVVITDGPRGAYAFDSEAGSGAGEMWFMPPYPDPKPPYERTGAGDAFASTFTAALALGKTVPEALRWAPINSMSVVQYIGAQKGLLGRRQIEDFLAKAPADYRPRRI